MWNGGRWAGSGGIGGGADELTSGVQEAFPVADGRIFLGQGPVGPAEALGGEDHLVFQLLELPEQLDGAPGQDDVVAEKQQTEEVTEVVELRNV